MRLEKSGVTFATKTILMQDYCSFEVKPINFLKLLICTPPSTNPWLDLNNTKPIRVITISPMRRVQYEVQYFGDW